MTNIVQYYFGKLGYLYEDASEYPRERDAMQMGVKIFKRKAMGICGSKTRKSLDEMLKLMVRTGMTNSIDDARRVLPELLDKDIVYGHYLPFFREKNLKITENKDERGNIFYNITAYDR